MTSLSQVALPHGDDVLDASSALDECIFGIDKSTCYELPLAKQQALRQRFVRESVEHHLSVCSQYRAFASRVAARSSHPLELDDVPLVPTAAFKRESPLSVPMSEVAKWCTSSGTQGKKSAVGRDRRTLERLLGSVSAGLRLIEDWYEHELYVINLGPDRREAGDVWFAYVMSLVELSFATTHEVINGNIDLARCATDVHLALDQWPQVGIVGPPFRILDLARHMSDRGWRINAGERLTVVTAGGWKRASGMAVPRACLEEQICETFGMNSTAQYRDAFNQVELNTVFFECSAHRKHIPPWIHARARDALTLMPVSHGEPGLLSFLDASATSYPAFIVGDDVGVVEEGACACGREGLFVRIERRVEGRAARGCALAMDQQVYGDSDT